MPHRSIHPGTAAKALSKCCNLGIRARHHISHGPSRSNVAILGLAQPMGHDTPARRAAPAEGKAQIDAQTQHGVFQLLGCVSRMAPVPRVFPSMEMNAAPSMRKFSWRSRPWHATARVSKRFTFARVHAGTHIDYATLRKAKLRAVAARQRDVGCAAHRARSTSATACLEKKGPARRKCAAQGCYLHLAPSSSSAAYSAFASGEFSSRSSPVFQAFWKSAPSCLT